MFEQLNLYLAALPPIGKLFWYCAIPSTILLFIQLILTFIGMGDSDADMTTDGMDFDHDFSIDYHDGDAGIDFHAETADGDTGGAFRFFTVKAVIFFLVGFGWGGIMANSHGYADFSSGIIAVVAGISMSALILIIMYSLSKLAYKGNMNIANALNKVGTAYLPITQNNGMIHVQIQGSLREIRAITKKEEKIPTGEKVKVVKLIDKETVLVESIS